MIGRSAIRPLGAIVTLALLLTACGGNGLVSGHPLAATITFYGPDAASGLSTHAPRSVRVSDPAAVRQLAAELDALPAIPPDARFSCPAAAGQHTDIRFVYSGRQPVVLRADSCVSIGRLASGGRVTDIRWLKGPADTAIRALDTPAGT